MLPRVEDKTDDSVRFLWLLAACSLLYVVGTLYIAAFQVFVPDDAAESRGFAAGSKLLGFATTFDFISGALTAMLYLQLASSEQPSLQWWAHTNGGSEWFLAAFARVLHSLALLFYGGAFCLLEVFVMAGASILEILGVVMPHVNFGSIVTSFGLLIALLWASKFEPVVNDVERQVEMFARMSPALQGNSGSPRASLVGGPSDSMIRH